ncbi:CST complex subunit TEN1 [Trifolium repens]|nr:CST complex subunit TEN1 [Trifolium repens]
MALFEAKSSALVTLQDLRPSSPFFKQGKSLRIIGTLQEYSLETGLATVNYGSDILKVSIEQLKDLKFQVGSVYQFIGELLIQPDNKGVLQARVGRNVDGIDLNLYHQSLLLLRQFQANHLNNSAT